MEWIQVYITRRNEENDTENIDVPLRMESRSSAINVEGNFYCDHLF